MKLPAILDGVTRGLAGGFNRVAMRRGNRGAISVTSREVTGGWMSKGACHDKRTTAATACRNTLHARLERPVAERPPISRCGWPPIKPPVRDVPALCATSACNSAGGWKGTTRGTCLLDLDTHIADLHSSFEKAKVPGRRRHRSLKRKSVSPGAWKTPSEDCQESPGATVAMIWPAVPNGWHHQVPRTHPSATRFKAQRSCAGSRGMAGRRRVRTRHLVMPSVGKRQAISSQQSRRAIPGSLRRESSTHQATHSCA